MSARAEWAVLEVVPPAAEYLAAAGVDSPRLDAELLLAHVLGCSRLDLYLRFDRPLAAREREAYRALLARRRRREPLQLITGETEFHGRVLGMRPGVFIPRQETEVLVERALELLPPGPARVLELGTGSGAVAVALACERPELEIAASDLSPEALALAAENAARHGVAGRIAFERADGLPAGEGVDLVLSNPPYVRRDEAEALPPEVRHDPEAALFGGEDGLDAYRLLAAQAPARLRPGGAVALEIGETQGGAVREILAAAGFDELRLHADLAGRERVITGRREIRD